MAHDGEILDREHSQALGELAAGRGVHSLQQSPVAGRGQAQVVVRKPVRPGSTEDADGQVFIDQDHGRAAGAEPCAAARFAVATGTPQVDCWTLGVAVEGDAAQLGPLDERAWKRRAALVTSPCTSLWAARSNLACRSAPAACLWPGRGRSLTWQT